MTIENNLEEHVEKKVEEDKLAMLKAKNAQKQQEKKVVAKIVAKKEKSLNFGVVGLGQCGGKIAQQFYSLGYGAVAVNTTTADLSSLKMPDTNKLLIQTGALGGAGRDLSIGEGAAESFAGEITNLINDKLNDSQVNVVTFSLGGGSGAGSSTTVIKLLGQIGKPIIVMAVLPMDTEDAQIKANALQTLAKLAKMAQNKEIANLFIVDNAKIEAIYSDVNSFDFFDTANKAIVDTFDALNVFSSMSSAVKAFDQMEYTKVILDSGGCSVFGEFTCDNYHVDTALAEAVIENLSNNLLSGGFDLKQAKYVGFVLAANKEVWSKIPTSSVNYANSMIQDMCPGVSGIFKGIYETDSTEDNVKVYSIFSGLGLPGDRVDQLKEEVKELQSKVKQKEETRNLTLTLDSGQNETISQAQKVKEKIAQKSSIFGKFVGNVNDRRK